ncbi:hypothetical protein ABAZ39_13125 [Azospirillum argentinense]|uniref:Uncharacterized protein n=1 Tax=Azospirillum argentinense TaxID=2970906 RepID=A0A060DJ53_9PROT|nr:hypothetical protein ABAZ39_13125 [Azospirillum argentinense]EZQ09902.1 hypothetical protein ABAZ39_14535 [Azospirillum argentinense]
MRDGVLVVALWTSNRAAPCVAEGMPIPEVDDAAGGHGRCGAAALHRHRNGVMRMDVARDRRETSIWPRA